MTNVQVKEQMRGQLIAVLRLEEEKLAEAACRRLYDHGITVLEVTFSVPHAPELIARLRRQLPGALVGAGTVLTAEEARLALQAGAQFVVSPCVSEEVAACCREAGVCFCLGAATPTEAWRAHQLGSDPVKLFPGECLSPAAVKAIRAPMPFLDLVPTGGVNPENLPAWKKAGAFAVGLGGYLTGGITWETLPDLDERCRLLLAAWQA